MGHFALGISHKDCPVEVRERLHFSTKKLSDALQSAKTSEDLSEIVILSTCNRVEFYGYAADGLLAENAILELVEKVHGLRREDWTQYLYRHSGKEAIRHLCRVAAGLDSLVVGENEILGQLREAFRAANEHETVHSLLYRLMEKALKVGKDVRHETRINEGAVSIPSVAVELAEKIFGRLGGERIMVLGTGDMSALALENLKNAGAMALYIVSRSRERAEPLLEKYQAKWIALEEAWEEHLQSVDILIASTSAPHPIIHYDQIKRVMSVRRGKPLFLVDIAVPRDIDPKVHSIEDVYLYNIDDLKGVSSSNLSRRAGEIKSAEAIVDRAVLDYQSWMEQLAARPTLERFESFLNEILEDEINRIGGRLNLNLDDRNEMRRRLRAKLVARPLEKIKEASQNGGVARYLEALHSLFHLDKKP